MAKLSPELRAALVALGRLGGKKRARRLSKEARRESARRAAQARWKNHVPKAQATKKKAAGS